jgi:hypothetical protein
MVSGEFRRVGAPADIVFLDDNLYFHKFYIKK